MTPDIDLRHALLIIFALVIAIPVHEFAHAVSAVNNGDDGPRRAGRLSIMPWDHFEPFGAFFSVMSAVWGFGLGWGKPVLVNPDVLHNPRWGMCKVAAWGPFSNLLLAIGFAIPFRLNLLGPGDFGLAELLFYCVQVNLTLMLFNLIPVGPLDGAKVLVAFLPDSAAFEFSRFMERFGFLLLLLLLWFGGPLLLVLVAEPAGYLRRLLIGA